MKYPVFLLLLIAPLATACPMPMYKDYTICCLSIGENYSADVMAFAKNCPTPYFMKDLSCCVYEKDINYTKEAYTDSNGTQYTLYRGPFYGEIAKKEEIRSVDPTKDPKLLEISQTKSTTPTQLKDYNVPLTKTTQQSNGNIIIAVIILAFLIILAIAWRLGKEDDEKEK